MLRIGSLFSGAGGLDMAVEQVFGGHTVWHCEVDKAASKVLAHRWPSVPNHSDITTVDWTQVEPVDILCGGWPCQPWSLAGKQKGFSDERALWPFIAEAIRWLRPQCVVLENVSAIARAEVADDPSDRCLCGWPYRRGGLHIRLQVRESAPDVHGADRCGDDNEGIGAITEAGDRVRRNGAPDPSGDSQVGRGAVLVGSGFRGISATGENRAISATQGRAGDGRAEGRGDSSITGNAWGESYTAAVDARGAWTLRDAQGSDARTEYEGPIDPATGEPVSVCPACGRSVGDRSNGYVFRSGLGEVQRDLAALGYDIAWTCLRASDVGAPHERKRLFIVAHPDGARLEGLGPSGYNQEHRPEPVGHRATTEPLRLLPTPGASDTRGRDLARATREGSGGDDLVTVVVGGYDTQWSEYAPAIGRWEQITRPAPYPTEPTRTGRQRLAPAFSEWLIGWPVGHVTDVPGISRNDQLRIVGNGVVPQQAQAAIRWLLNVSEAVA